MTKILLVLAGGALGALARYGVAGITNKYFAGTFPLGTLVVNLAGSLLIGFLWGLWESDDISAGMRAFIFIGLLGGFTTFSTYSIETFNLFKYGETKMALMNILLSNILGLLFVYVGFVCSKAFYEVLK